MSHFASKGIKWNVNAKVDSRPVVRIGMWSIGFTLLVFFLWGTFAQLDSAVITPGTVVSEGRNKLIQHSVGGRVARIYVREGDVLSEGQVVLELDPTKAEADLSRIEARYASLSALKARLQAERHGGIEAMPTRTPSLGGLRLREADPINTSTLQLRGAQDAMIVEPANKADPIAQLIASPSQGTRSNVPMSDDDYLMDSQREAYQSGRNLLSQEIIALERKAETLAQQKQGQLARISAQQRLLSLTRKEVRRLRPLAASGYVSRSRLENREKTLAEIEGNVASMKLDAMTFDNQKVEIDVQIERAKIAKSDVAAKEYARIIAELAEISDQRRAARASVNDMVVRAPVSGRLTSLSVTTEGGVFGSGDVIGEVVPADAPLLVEARVAPSDIDFIKRGQKADIAITAFDRRLDDTLQGEVVYVSADAEEDEKSRDQYFVSRLRFVPKAKDAANMAKLQAGMQGEVYIHTGSRTFLTYLTKPLLDSFRRAFRER